jgi:pyrroloquinoline quinone (PQQ) biosynthesis protein C
MISPAPSLCLDRSVPFLSVSADGTKTILLLDRFEISLDELANKPQLCERIGKSLDISFLGPLVSVEEAEALFLEQYAVASEYVYGHSFWESIRQGSQSSLLAYMLETRHYLAASASRMSPSIKPGVGLTPLLLLLSQHLLEEWDHAKFFSEALESIGCSSLLASDARPIPATLEWIHITRSIAFRSDLSAALCSGFMEYSSKESDTVRMWHSMLVERGLISEEANKSIIRHLDTDVSFDHAENWKRAIELHGPMIPVEAANALNDVATISEAIYRWLSALENGCSSSIVRGLQILTEEKLLSRPCPPQKIYDAAIFNGLPVWPSAVMQLVNAGNCDTTDAARIITGLTYALGHREQQMRETDDKMLSIVSNNARALANITAPDCTSIASLEETITSWLCAIDGHALWDAMMQEESDWLVVGYILENYHYLASAARHIGAAISACTNTEIRLQLIEHFEDELRHCELLEGKLAELAGVSSVSSMRPLSTTTAFVGFLENIAHQDWRGYILVSTFLQKSLSECRPANRHAEFYQEVIDRNPNAGNLLKTIWAHDELDFDLGHDARPSQRLRALIAEEPVTCSSLRHAAMAPALTWSFLDGIMTHYANGQGAVTQRIGWHTCQT